MTYEEFKPTESDYRLVTPLRGLCSIGKRQVYRLERHIIIIIIYSCCSRSAYAIDHAPTDAGGACKTSSQRTRARTTRDHTILITIQFFLVSHINNTKLLTSFNNALKSSLFQFSNPKIKLALLKLSSVLNSPNLPPIDFLILP